MADIPIVGVPSSWRYPGGYAQILFGQGPSTSAGGRRQIVFPMAMIDGVGTWTPNTLYRVRSASQAELGGGPGSPVHRALDSAITSNKNADYYALPYIFAGDGSTATLILTFTGTATGTGTATVTVCGEKCSFVFRSGDDQDAVAAGLAVAISGKTILPAGATATGGALTIETKIAGASQGTGDGNGQYQVRCEISDTSLGITVDVTSGELGDDQAGSDGSGAQSDALDAALATLSATRRYYIGIDAFDADSLDKAKQRVSTEAEPIPGFRERVFACFNGILGDGQTLAVGENYERMQLAWATDDDSDVAFIVGNLCAVFQADEEITSAASFDLYRGSPFGAATWNVKGCFNPANRPDKQDCNDAINDGLMPLGTDDGGSFIVMAVTTRSKDAGGTQDDFRAAEPHRVSIADEWTDLILARDAATWTNALLQEDKLLDPNRPRTDSNIDTNQRLPVIAGRKVVTPFVWKKWYFGELDKFADGHFQALDAMKAATRVQRDPNNTGRIEVGSDLRTVDVAHQRTLALAEVSPG
jgi:phage tail sheath gpL-like